MCIHRDMCRDTPMSSGTYSGTHYVVRDMCKDTNMSSGTFVVNDEAFGMLSPFLYLHAWTSFVAQNVILLVPSAQMHPLTLQN